MSRVAGIIARRDWTSINTISDQYSERSGDPGACYSTNNSFRACWSSPFDPRRLHRYPSLLYMALSTNSAWQRVRFLQSHGSACCPQCCSGSGHNDCQSALPGVRNGSPDRRVGRGPGFLFAHLARPLAWAPRGTPQSHQPVQAQRIFMKCSLLARCQGL